MIVKVIAVVDKGFVFEFGFDDEKKVFDKNQRQKKETVLIITKQKQAVAAAATTTINKHTHNEYLMLCVHVVEAHQTTDQPHDIFFRTYI